MASHDVPRAARPRTEDERRLELDKIEKYRSLEEQFRQQVAAAEFGSEMFQLTTKLLRLNPEYYTVWNVRRRCLLCGALAEPSSERQTSGTESPDADDGEAHEVIRSELAFIVPLLMQHPKCYWIWNYRMWILQQAVEKLRLPAARAIWEEELGLVGKMLHRDRRNYHAWAYRRHIVGQLESSSLQGESMVEAEFEYTTRMIHMDLSNFSAWHNRSQLLCRLLDERSSDDTVRKRFLENEFDLVRNGLNVGPEDQSLWYYHQFLISSVVETQRDRPLIAPHLTDAERAAYLNREIEDIKELLDDFDDVKWIYEALVEYSLAARLFKESTEGEFESNQLVAQWLGKLRELDPMRNGRWDDLAKDLGLANSS